MLFQKRETLDQAINAVLAHAVAAEIDAALPVASRAEVIEGLMHVFAVNAKFLCARNDLPELAYQFHDRTATVTQCGRLCIGRRKINLSHVFAGQNLGIKEVAENIWLVTFMDYDLCFFDHQTGRVECATNPFGAKALPM